MSLSIKFDSSGLNAALDKLGDGVNQQVRPAAQAGAQVLYEEVKQRAPVSEGKEHYFYSTSGKKYGPFSPGNLKNSIYQVFSSEQSKAGKAVYHISWNTRIGKQIAYAPYGWMVENGTSRTRAVPFLRPAYDASVKAALEAARDKMNEGVQKVIAGVQS